MVMWKLTEVHDHEQPDDVVVGEELDLLDQQHFQQLTESVDRIDRIYDRGDVHHHDRCVAVGDLDVPVLDSDYWEVDSLLWLVDPDTPEVFW